MMDFEGLFSHPLTQENHAVAPEIADLAVELTFSAESEITDEP
ncbi:hypothetical protein [Gordonia sp. CPCC 206044]